MTKFEIAKTTAEILEVAYNAIIERDKWDNFTYDSVTLKNINKIGKNITHYTLK